MQTVSLSPRPLALLRVPAARSRTGDSNSGFYDKIAQGLMVRTIKVGARAAAVAEHEIEAINAARLAGKSDDEIRALVAALHARRLQT